MGVQTKVLQWMKSSYILFINVLLQNSFCKFPHDIGQRGHSHFGWHILVHSTCNLQKKRQTFLACPMFGLQLHSSELKVISCWMEGPSQLLRSSFKSVFLPPNAVQCLWPPVVHVESQVT